MARMIEGEWEGDWRPTDGESDGRFHRKPTTFRDEIPEHIPDSGRYHLFVAWACPWAHRTLITRSLKGLTDLIPVHFANELTDRSWRFEDDAEALAGEEFLYELYLRADPEYTGRVTVPVLWDAEEDGIVNNESSEIIAMLDALPSDAPALRPDQWLDEIDEINEAMYDALNNGVYRTGFATEQAAYDEAVTDVFAMLEVLEERLEGREWLVGDRLTESDVRLFVTTFRFDGAYVPFFRCNKKRITDYPNIHAHLQRMYRYPGIAETCNFEEMRRGYGSIEQVNPTGIIPIGPDPRID